MPVNSNIISFVRRFTPMGKLTDNQTEALFFLFRTRDLNRLNTLPRDTILQRFALDRAAAGQPWQTGSGYIRL